MNKSGSEKSGATSEKQPHGSSGNKASASYPAALDDSDLQDYLVKPTDNITDLLMGCLGGGNSINGKS